MSRDGAHANRLVTQRLARRDLLVQGARLAGGIALLGGAHATSGATAASPAIAAPGLQSTRGTITGGKVGDFTTFDPWFIVASNRAAHRQLFNGLVYLDKDGAFQPSLAESWEFSAENRALTIRLRPTVTFHNGRTLVAADVVANIERAKDATIGHALSTAAGAIAGANAIDDATVEVTYDQPQPSRVALEFFDSLFIIAPEAMGDVQSAPIGTGPYVLDEWVTGEQAVFTKFNDYWNIGLPKTERLVVKIFSDVPAMILNYQGGELDWISDPPYSERPRLAEGDSQVLTYETLGAFWELTLNVNQEPFDRKEVRQAIAYSINREAIVQNVFFGGSRAISTPFFREADPIYTADQATRYQYNLDQARALLEEAGVADLSVTANAGSHLPETGLNLQIIQGDLREIGIDLQIAELEAAVFSERWLGGEFQLCSSAQAVPQRDLSALFDTVASFRADERNNAHWFDETYQSLAQEAKTLLDEQARLAMYGQLRDIIVEESWVIPIATRPIAYAVRASMEGFDTSVSDFLMLEQASMPD